MGYLKNIFIKVPLWSIRKATWILFISFLGSLLIGITAFILYMRSLPSLNIWHTTALENEFVHNANIKNFDAYLKLEERLFIELDEKIYNRVSTNVKNSIHRYTKNSISDPRRWDKAWNRSFELPVKNPKAGILLVHGMSDSPYSLHTQAEYLHKRGVWVVAIRLPGHGTIPSALREVKWEDMASVVKIGMKRLNEKVGDNPIHIMGYSTGAPLALNYTLLALNDSTLTLPASLIFYSPAIGVTKAASLALWQSRIGRFLGLPKLEWNSITPEFDPFKYASFAVNAGDQVYRVCNEVQNQLDSYLTNTESLKPFPPILSFASTLDSTVKVQDTVDNLYDRLPKGEHTLVLFDINHDFINENLIKKNVLNGLTKLRKTSQKTYYTFDLISDINSTDPYLMEIRNGESIKKLSYMWPKGLYSLSHLAMPFSPNDPLYGSKNAPKSPGIQLGHMALHGETSTLEISAGLSIKATMESFS